MESQGALMNKNTLPTSIEGIVSALARRGCLDLTPSINPTACSDHPLAGGGFCEVYQGTLFNGTRVAIKSLKVYGSQLEWDDEGQRVLKRAAKEIYHWSKLKHRNVLPLMGLSVFKGFISMISGWMENGNLPSYLKRNPDADRIRLCMGVCAGLRYIHECEMAHGDLKGANIMISPDGIAMITDFGNARLQDLTLQFGNTTSRGLSHRWAAPELLLEDDVPQVSMEADVYAYGMTVLEALTGKVPYAGANERRVMMLVTSEKKVPPRPDSGISDGLWELLNSCWAWKPSERPKITSVGDRLEALFTPAPILPITPPVAPVPAAPDARDALHNIGVRVFDVLIAGGKPVDAAAVRAWAGVVGASHAWGEVVVEIVEATRAKPGTLTSFNGPPPENLDQLGTDALSACALMCLGIPGAEEVLAKRLEERRWGEDMVETGVAEHWQRASEVFVNLAAAGVAGAAEAKSKLAAMQIGLPTRPPPGESAQREARRRRYRGHPHGHGREERLPSPGGPGRAAPSAASVQI